MEHCSGTDIVSKRVQERNSKVKGASQFGEQTELLFSAGKTLIDFKSCLCQN